MSVPTPPAASAPAPTDGARPRAGLIAGLCVTLTALVVSALFLLPTGASDGSVIATTGELQALEPQQPPPRTAGGAPVLGLEASGLAFPDFAPAFGWRPLGVRRDRVGDREVVTVLYERAGRRMGYSVISGGVLEPPRDSRRAAREGTLLRSFEVGGRTVVTAARAGRTVVVSGVGVPRRVLYDLAGWRGGGAIAF